jgi:mono/diheme cytochrome c family protein
MMLAAILSLAGAVCVAQSAGEATYKARCQICHGATGAADTAPAKVIGVRPVSDPAVRRMDMAEMIDIVTNGKNKMQAFKDKLSDAEIRAAVIYFRTLIK